MPKQTESDSAFLAKLVLFFILGSLWLRVEIGNEPSAYVIPLGFLLGLYFAHHEHFQIDRKIEYLVLFMASIISFFLPIGLVLPT